MGVRGGIVGSVEGVWVVRVTRTGDWGLGTTGSGTGDDGEVTVFVEGEEVGAGEESARRIRNGLAGGVVNKTDWQQHHLQSPPAY